MSRSSTSVLDRILVLAVDDEPDVLETIEDILDSSRIDKAFDYETAVEKIEAEKYDLAILDIMGVNGLELLELTVAAGIPSVMLTAHAVTPESLIASKRKGALSFLPKEELANLDAYLEELLPLAGERTESAWSGLFSKLGGYFESRFGAGWLKKK